MEYIYCRRCGRRLKSPQSKILGYGTNCYKKVNACRKKISILDKSYILYGERRDTETRKTRN